MKNIVVKDKIINVTGVNDDDYVSLTVIARFKTDGETNPVIANWMRKVDTLEFLKLWEQISNTNFKPTDFEGFKSKPGENAFTISPKKWIELTNAIGIRVKSGKNGGTFAMPEIECDMQPKKRGNMFLFYFIATGIESIEDMKMAYIEILNNENFKRVEFDPFKMESGKNSFVMTPTKWVNDYIKQKIINILMQM